MYVIQLILIQTQILFSIKGYRNFELRYNEKQGKDGEILSQMINSKLY